MLWLFMFLWGMTAIAAPSPWDSWRSGYTNFEHGETLRERGNYTDALKYFERARKNYQAVRSARPDWNQRVISDRLRDCDRQITELRRLLGESSKKTASSGVGDNIKKTEATVRGKQVSVKQPAAQPARVSVKQSTSQPAGSRPEYTHASNTEYSVSIGVQELAKLKREISDLQLKNRKLENELQKQRNLESEIAALLRDRKIAADKYALLEKRYQALTLELKRPEERIKTLEQRLVSERMNLERLDKQLGAVQQQLKIEKENARLSNVAKNALEDLLKQRNEEVLKINRNLSDLTAKITELEKFQGLYKQSLQQLDSANKEIAGLNKQLSELSKNNADLLEKQLDSQKQIAVLTAERDALGKNKDAATIADRKLAVEISLNAERQKQLDAAEKRNKELQNQLNAASRRHGDLQRQKNEADLKIVTLQRQLDAIGSDLRSLQNKYSALEEAHRLVQMNLEQEKNSARINAVELSGLRERNRGLEEDVKRLFDRAEGLEKRLAARDNADFRAAASARESVKKLEEDLKIAQSEITSLRGMLDTGKNSLVETERKLRAVNDENLKNRDEIIRAMENEKKLRQEIASLQQLRGQYEQLKKNFNALAVENRENRALAEAAKPRQAELERAKLRLMENANLKQKLASEQRLNADLKSSYEQQSAELTQLRKKAGEFEASRRRLIELEAAVKELERFKNLERDLAVLREREMELVSLKVKFNEQESVLNRIRSEMAALQRNKSIIEQKLASAKNLREEVQKLRRANKELEALIRNQTSELETLNKRISVLQSDAVKDVHIACRAEIEKLRTAAAAAAALNDRITQLQEQLQKANTDNGQLRQQCQDAAKISDLKSNEIAKLKTLNRELAELQQKSASELLGKIDASKLERLEEELEAVNKLNAELAVERDRLNAIINQRESEASQKTYVRHSNRSPEELVGLGIVAERDGKVELAIWNYQQALAANKDFVLAHQRLGMIYYQRGNYSDASGHLDTALKNAPENVSLALDTARCHIANQRFGNAKIIIDRIKKLQPENPYVMMCDALIDAGLERPSEAEQKLLSAERLLPDSVEIQLELARLLASSISDRRNEAVIFYERARDMGAPPDPALEKVLGYELDYRRERMRFMADAAREAELNNDWGSAVWYYHKIVSEKHPAFLPLLAFARFKAGDTGRALEELEKVDNGDVVPKNDLPRVRPHVKVVETLIALAEKDEQTAMRAAMASAGAKIPSSWIGISKELENLRRQSKLSPAAVRLLQNIDAGKSLKKK